MGANVRCILSSGARLRDVAKVAGALLGNKAEHTPIAGSDGIFASVAGVKVETTSMPEMASIVISLSKDNPAARAIAKSDGETYSMSYHFESGPNNEPSLLPASTPAKIALCVGLAKFFGGTVDFNDCDSKDVDFKSEQSADIHAQDGEEWNHLQKRIIAVKPITQKQIDRYIKRAAY